MNFTIITAVIAIIRALVALVGEFRAIAKQNKSLSQQEEAMLDSQLKTIMDPATRPAHWRIEP